MHVGAAAGERGAEERAEQTVEFAVRGRGRGRVRPERGGGEAVGEGEVGVRAVAAATALRTIRDCTSRRAARGSSGIGTGPGTAAAATAGAGAGAGAGRAAWRAGARVPAAGASVLPGPASAGMRSSGSPTQR
ncbi:hypothetical protein ACFQ1I_33535 [Kitasatospora arboriphila]